MFVPAARLINFVKLMKLANIIEPVPSAGI
jgi:hypothetical protein